MVARSIFTVGLLLFVASGAYYIFQIFSYQYIPEISDDFCWGTKEQCLKDSKVYPFRINVQKQQIDDLMSRLENARPFTPSLENSGTQYGLNEQVLNTVLDFIKKDYNFTERQIFLNSFPQFTTNIQGLNIHFIHVKSKTKGDVPVIPILLLHGWPTSVREFYESIPILMSNKHENKFSIELVIPSLIGFGYSDGASKPGFRSAQAANVMKLLMNRLGYEKFVVHGSDWGAVTVTALATLYPESVVAYHSNFCFSLRSVTLAKMFLGSLWPRAIVEDKYQNKIYPLTELVRFYFAESGYFHLMGTKPDTIGHVLDNSPVGLITFLLEKLSIGKNKNNIYSNTAGLEEFDLTQLVDIILYYYWFPKKATTAARFYCENSSLDGLLFGLHNVPINDTVPCACAFFEDEFLYQPESFLRDKYPNLIQYTTYPKIGHFAAVESNELLTNDIINLITKLYNSKLL